MKSLVNFITEAQTEHTLALKLQKEFASLLYKKKDDFEYGFPELIEFCKKIFAPKGHFDTVIYSPMEEHEKTLREYIKDDKNKKEFEKVFQNAINFNIPSKDQSVITSAYSLSRSGINAKIDLFVQIVFASLRKIDKDKNINLLEEPIKIKYSK